VPRPHIQFNGTRSGISLVVSIRIIGDDRSEQIDESTTEIGESTLEGSTQTNGSTTEIGGSTNEGSIQTDESIQNGSVAFVNNALVLNPTSITPFTNKKHIIKFIHLVSASNGIYEDPFDINLDGWGEQVNEDLESYDEIFSELYQKYKGGKMSPELSLLLRLGFSASVINFTNKALSTATPGFNDVIKQSPELMKMFTKATVQSMSQQSPGFNFASNMMGKDDTINTTYGSPPPPVETKLQPPSQRPPLNNMQFSQRPDINAGRGSMFREDGVVMNNYQEIKRPEMKGPQNTDVNKLFSGLKTQESLPPIKDENDSMISISSMKELTSSKPPKKTNRRKTSEKNTISLDI
jgi:Family of unknown function (DUF5767)